MNFLRPRKFYSRKVLSMALPVIAGLSTQMLLSLVDTGMVGRLGNAEYALAAMSLGLLATYAIIAFSSSLSTGTHVLTARRFGEKNYSACRDVIFNSLVLCVGMGIVAASLGMWGSQDIANLFAADPKVADLTAEYMFFRFMGLPFFMMSVAFRGFYFGIGETRVFMVSAIAMNFLNIFLNWVLIFGNLGAPALGLAGAAVASSLATTFDGLFQLVVAIVFRQYRVRFRLLHRLRFYKDIIRSIFKISLPVSFQNVFLLLGFLIFVAFTGLIGTLEQSASQTIIATLFLSILPSQAFGIAAQTLVGNAMGSGKKMLAKILGFETAKIATFYTGSLGLLLMLFPELFLMITTDEEHIIQAAVPALRMVGFAQIFFGTGTALANALQALGKTFYVMMAEMIVNLFIFVPIAYIVGIVLDLGLAAIWSTMIVYTIIYASVMYYYFQWGVWNRLKKI